MWLSQYRLTRFVAAALSRTSQASSKSRRPRIPLFPEQLEDRTTPATITPTTFNDGVGIGSLRDAILQADSNGQNNTIVLSAGVYQLSVQGRDESAGMTGDLNLTASGFTENIEGAGPNATIINANQIDRVFEISPNVTVIFSNLTITGGQAMDGGLVGGTNAIGGGILNDSGNVTLNQVVVTYNVAQANTSQSALGGGIYSNGGSLTITDSTITNNTVIGGAGVNGTNGQPSGNGGNGGSGGDAQGAGIYVSGGTLTITNSLIENNRALGGQGGQGGQGGNVTVRPTRTRGFYGTTGPFFTGGFYGGTTGFYGGSSGFYGGSGGFTGGGFSGGFSGGGFSGGGGGSSLRADPANGRGGVGGVGGVGGRAQGGGIYVGNGTAHISGTTITKNRATGGSGGMGGAPGANGVSGNGGPGGVSQGGGAFIGGGTVALLSSNLTGNIADQADGGAPGSPLTGDALSGAGPLGQGINLFVGGGSVDTTGSTIAYKDKVAVIRPAADGNALFTLDSEGSGIYDSTDASFEFGLATDQVVSGDWSGNGFDQIGVVRPTANGTLEWILDTNGDEQYDSGDEVYYFGAVGDIPVVGDWNGAGKSEIGVVRPTASGMLQWTLDTNGDGVYDSGDSVFYFGVNGDIPVIGDWNGAGKDEIGVVRPSNGALTWTLDTNGDGVYDSGDQVFTYGAAGDHPIVGDWTAMGTSEIGVYRTDAQQNTLLFTLNSSGTGVYSPSDEVFTFGQPGDHVLTGKWPSPVQMPGQDLKAASGPHLLGASFGPLTDAQLAPLVNEATDIWMDTGLDPLQIQNLQQETVRVGSLPNGLLGYTRGETITLSPNAAGYGWYVDSTPANNSEFSVSTNVGLQALNGSPASGRMDLLTAILHEEGHIVGLGDLSPSLYPDDVMTGTLPTGTRRLPRVGEAEAAD